MDRFGVIFHSAGQLTVAGLTHQGIAAYIEHHQTAVHIPDGGEGITAPGGLGFIQILFIQPDIVAHLLELQHIPPDPLLVFGTVADKNIGFVHITGTNLLQNFV